MTLDPMHKPRSEITNEESRVIKARMRGLTLQEIADDLRISMTTAWRREKSAVQKLRMEA